jgi:glucokinase
VEAGQRAGLFLKEGKRMLLGIEIGGSKLQLVLGDAHGDIQEKRKLAVPPGEVASGIRQQIEQALAELLRGRKPDAVGVGFGGPVDWRGGKIACSHQIEGWSGFDLAGWLRPLIGVPVVVENDSNLAALGEATRGAGTGFNPVFYFNMGSGVGGGLVVGGAIYHGATPGEMEFGHLRLERGGTIVEAKCSGWAVDRKIRRELTAAPTSVLARLTAQSAGGEARHLAEALREGDALAQRVLAETAEDLAFALSHAVHLLHPQVLVMGGGLSLVGEPLRAAVAAALPQFVMEAFLPPPQVCLAKLGEDSVPVGALCLAAGTRRAGCKPA